MSCVIENLTTIDEYIMERQERNARKLKRPYKWPYDLGFKRNWIMFFGPTWWKWFIPGMGPKNDGMHFERRSD